MGILAGTILYPSISESKKKKFALWGVRIVALVLIIVAFALTTKNFCESTVSINHIKGTQVADEAT